MLVLAAVCRSLPKQEPQSDESRVVVSSRTSKQCDSPKEEAYPNDLSGMKPLQSTSSKEGAGQIAKVEDLERLESHHEAVDGQRTETHHEYWLPCRPKSV